MNYLKLKKLAGAACLAAAVACSGCHKQVAASTPPPPPPAPAAPNANMSANPPAINQGQSATLTWQSTNANDASISGVGAVPVSGSKVVYPTQSTTYTLAAKGPGGNTVATARVTVNPPPPTAASAAPSMTEEQLFDQNVHDVYFDYDKYNLRPQGPTVAEKDAAFLKQYPNIKILIEAHCDERGSEEYNLALGENRGESLEKALAADGVSASQIRVVSLGKEKPFCTESTEQCWQQNRRDHLVFDR